MMSDERHWKHYRAILASLHAVRTREANASLARGALLSFALILAVILVVASIELIGHLGMSVRTVLFFGAVAGSLAMCVWFAGPALLRRVGILPLPSDDAVALKVGGHFPQLQDRLLNVMQIYREAHEEAHPAYSPALVDASFSDVSTAFSALDLGPVVDRRPVKIAWRSFLFAAGFTALAFAMFPSDMSQALHRLLHFRTDFAPPAPFEFIVLPGDREAVKGETIVLRAKTTLAHQPAISFLVREETQSAFDAVKSGHDSLGNATYTIPSIRTSTVYYAEAEGYRSRQFTINVLDRPFIRNMRLKLSFPSYSGLPTRYLEDNSGDVTALAGTTVTYDLTLNKDVSEARLVMSDSHDLRLTVNGRYATGSLRVMRDRSYHIALQDAAGVANINPINYSIKIVPDAAPTVLIEEPGPNTELDEQMRLPLLMRVTDDFGFTKMLLHYRLVASRYEQAQSDYKTAPIPLPTQQKTEMEVPFIWNLSSMNLAPEDVVNYYVEVFDNDNVNGPKSSRSQIYTVRLPSMDEVFAKADKTQQKAIDDLKKTMDAAEDVQKSMENLQREMRQQNNEKLDWQQKKKLEDLMKRQEKMTEDVRQVSEQLEKLNEDMQKQNVVSEETMKKYQELQQLFQQVDAPQLREAMKKMNEAMQQLTPEQMREAMKNFTFNEENFRKSIERTMELLKRLQIEQKVDELAKRSEEMARKQEDLANKAENADPKNQKELDQLAKDQQDLKKDLEAMQREMQELQQKMQEFPKDMPLSEMQEAQAELNLSQMQQEMSDAAGQCQGGNCKNASKGQKKMAQQMKKFQKKMESVKKKLNEDQERKVMQAFRKALDNILQLSKDQEQLKNEAAKLPPNSQQFRDMMERQADLGEELKNTANELMELGKKSFAVNPQMGQHIGEAMKKMRQSLEDMKNRNPQACSENQGGAMGELNEAAKNIAQSMSSMKSGGSKPGGSLMQQLGGMARQQMGINQGTQQMSQQQMMQQTQQMQRLAQQQAALQKSLQELNEEAKRSADGKKLLGDLNKIAEDMQEVVRDMQQNDVNPNTIQKQERILSRLLDASRSQRERDWEKKRRSETGKDVARRGPAELDPNAQNPQQGLKYDLQKAINEGYSRDYEDLIRRYFDALQHVVGDSKN
jgi:hypothetical protein